MVAMRQASKADHVLRIGANAWHHLDPLGTAGVITNEAGQVVSNNLYDLFGVLRYQQGSAETPWRWKEQRGEAEGYLIVPQQACSVVASVNVSMSANCINPPLPPRPLPTPKPLPPWLVGPCYMICGPLLAGSLGFAWYECEQRGHSGLELIECILCSVLTSNRNLIMGGCAACVCARWGPWAAAICGIVVSGGGYLYCRWRGYNSVVVVYR
jgi:hypothetical protein